MKELNSFSMFTSTGPSKTFPGDFLRAIPCTASDHSPNALKVLTKLINISYCGGSSRICLASSIESYPISLVEKSSICPSAVEEV